MHYWMQFIINSYQLMHLMSARSSLLGCKWSLVHEMTIFTVVCYGESYVQWKLGHTSIIHPYIHQYTWLPDSAAGHGMLHGAKPVDCHLCLGHRFCTLMRWGNNTEKHPHLFCINSPIHHKQEHSVCSQSWYFNISNYSWELPINL